MTDCSFYLPPPKQVVSKYTKNPGRFWPLGRPEVDRTTTGSSRSGSRTSSTGRVPYAHSSCLTRKMREEAHRSAPTLPPCTLAGRLAAPSLLAAPSARHITEHTSSQSSVDRVPRECRAKLLPKTSDQVRPPEHRNWPLTHATCLNQKDRRRVSQSIRSGRSQEDRVSESGGH